MKKIIFFGGKGGVGKTSCASAYALASAKSGDKTLLVSTDTAHSLSDIFNKKLGPKEKKIEENLYCIEIDADEEAKKYIEGIKKNISESIDPNVVEEIKKQLDMAYVSPGTQENALFDKIMDLIETKIGGYKRIVFDTAPTGATLRLISLYTLLEDWITSLIKRRKSILNKFEIASKTFPELEKKYKDDPVLKILEKRRIDILKGRKILTDKGNTGFYFVITPEKLSIQETDRSVKILEDLNISIEGIIVNRVIPETEDEFLSKRKKVQNEKMEEIKVLFKEYPIIYMPLLDSEVEGIDTLMKYSRILVDQIS